MANSGSQTNSGNRGQAVDRILIVEADSAVGDLIGRQALQSVGYQVQVATDATSAIARALQWSPDLIMVDLNLPGLSGKDLLVALASQGIKTPVLVMAARGMEADIVQTFRLGASDYILLPAREAEVVNAVSRVMQQVHDRRERDRLAGQLEQANQDLQSRVRELTTIFALGKAMTSITDQAVLLEKILEAAIHITRADLGWLLLREDASRPFVVAAEHGLPPALGVRLNQPWDDGISSLVAMSGEILSMYGAPLKRFKISSLGQSALIVPIKVQKKVLGLLVMLRKQPEPFNPSQQHLLSALADYASIALVNVRLFRTAEARARSLQHVVDAAQMGENIQNEILWMVKKEISAPSQTALAALEQISKDLTTRLRPDQRQLLTNVQDQLLHIHQVAGAIDPLQWMKSDAARGPVNLNELVAQTVHGMQFYAQQGGITFVPEITRDALIVFGEGSLLCQALEAVIGNAVKYSNAGGQVCIRLERTPEGQAHLLIHNKGRILDPKIAEKVFNVPHGQKPEQPPGADAGTRFSGLGIRLPLVQNIITYHQGKIWLEGLADKGTNLHILLPLSKK